MPTFEQRMSQITLKIDRANEHLAELQQSRHEFLATKPYKVAVKRSADNRPIYYVADVVPTPVQLVLVAADVIQNLATALDHLAYQLVCIDTTDNPPNPRGIFFPMADSQANYDTTKIARMPGASLRTIAAVDVVKPYREGNEPLWMLHRLNQVEKHRMLLTAGSQAAGIHLGQTMANSLTADFPPEARELFENMTLFLSPADKGFPLQAGFQLFIGDVNEQPNPKQSFRFNIALNEPGIVEGKPLLETIQSMSKAVTDTVRILTPCLRG